jgi:acyl-CoA reductase-like NAD-dependent aldehyde dehydrogenase
MDINLVRVNGVDEAVRIANGVKASGYGRFGGRWGIDAFTETRWITIEDPHQHYPF